MQSYNYLRFPQNSITLLLLLLTLLRNIYPNNSSAVICRPARREYILSERPWGVMYAVLQKYYDYAKTQH